MAVKRNTGTSATIQRVRKPAWSNAGPLPRARVSDVESNIEICTSKGKTCWRLELVESLQGSSWSFELCKKEEELSPMAKQEAETAPTPHRGIALRAGR